MLSKEDFMFSVGFQGNAAIVDSSLKRRYGKLSVSELLELGLFKPAICAAIADGDDAELEKIFLYYNEKADVKLKARDELKKVFGISRIPDEIEKIIKI